MSTPESPETAPEPLILLRLMVEVDTEAKAAEEMRRAEARIAGIATVAARCPAKPYWKIPEYWEISLDLRPTVPAPAAYERLIALAEAGWTLGEVAEEDEERWAVWNPAPGVEFLSPRARWAHLQLLPRGLGEPADPADFLDIDAEE